MPVNATIGTSLALNPSKVRYSLFQRSEAGSIAGNLTLQRSDKREDGTWIDDPRPGSVHALRLPADDAGITAAIAGVVALLPSIMARLNRTDAFTDYNVTLQGRLSPTGVLDVMVVVRFMTDDWQTLVVPSLNTFLAENMDLAASVLTAWAALDAAIDAANATAKWL